MERERVPPGPPGVPALAIRGFSKSFGGERALDGADFVVLPGEVHGLLGQNGSGKSTLIKVLAGYHAPERGELEVRGHAVPLPLEPGQFRELGISFVHQDLGLVPSLSVVENLLVGELATRRRWRISWRRERRRARELFDFYDVELDPRALVAHLPQVDRALLAIVRAVHELRVQQHLLHASTVLVLDEPTVFLPKNHVERLFALVRRIAAEGASVVFVSHDLDEVREVTDRVTVLRDGRNAGTVVTSETTEQELVELIVGRRFELFETARHDLSEEAVDVKIEDLCGRRVEHFSASVRRGEIVGLAGLAGSGFSDVPYLLFGAAPAQSGRITIKDETHDLTRIRPGQAIAAGMALIPADRAGAGSIGTLPIVDNLLMLSLDRYQSGPLLRREQMAVDSRRLLEDYDVTPPLPRLTYQSLSGGNQQKVLLAKWMQTEMPVLLLDEPAQGVDVAARQQIFRLISDAAERGAAVLCSSTDYEQLAQICDRVLVFGRGRVVSELAGVQVTKDAIAERCYNSFSLARTAGLPA